MEKKTIDQLLSSISALVGDARGSLFGQDKCMVDRDQLLYLVDELQTQLPSEIEEARTIIDNCNALRTNAKKDAAETRRQADDILREAEERAEKMVEETEIIAAARQREDELTREAEGKRARLISGAMEYADRILADAEQAVTETMTTLNEGIAALQSKCRQDLDNSMHQLKGARTAIQSVVLANCSEKTEG